MRNMLFTEVFSKVLFKDWYHLEVWNPLDMYSGPGDIGLY